MFCFVDLLEQLGSAQAKEEATIGMQEKRYRTGNSKSALEHAATETRHFKFLGRAIVCQLAL